MKTIFTTFCATSLLWSCALLYCFASGKVERPPVDYVSVMQEAQPVHLARK